MKEGDVELLKKIAEFEETADWEREFRLGWSWRDVRIWPATLNRFCLQGFLDTLFKSNSYTGYRLTDLGKALARGEQLPEFQGRYDEVRAKILAHAPKSAQFFHGMWNVSGNAVTRRDW